MIEYDFTISAAERATYEVGRKGCQLLHLCLLKN